MPATANPISGSMATIIFPAPIFEPWLLTVTAVPPVDWQARNVPIGSPVACPEFLKADDKQVLIWFTFESVTAHWSKQLLPFQSWISLSRLELLTWKGGLMRKGSSTSEDGTARSCNVRGVGLGVPVTESGVVDWFGLYPFAGHHFCLVCRYKRRKFCLGFFLLFSNTRF